MGRAPCCDKANVKRGPWSPEEDATLKSYLQTHGTGGNWIALPRKAGLRRCGKSCRLRWLNYLRPDIKHGGFTDDEDRTICELYNQLGSRWSVIASHLPGRTDNDVKNYWNTKLKKKFLAGKISLTPNNYITNCAQIPITTNTTSINITTPIINHPNTKPPNDSLFVPKLETDHHEFTTHNHGLLISSNVHDHQRPSFSYDVQSSLFGFNSPRVFMDFSSSSDHHDQLIIDHNNEANIPKINSYIDQLLSGSGSNNNNNNNNNNNIPVDSSNSVTALNDDVKGGDGCDGGYGWSSGGASLVEFGFGLPYSDIMSTGLSFDQEKGAIY